MSRKHHSAAIAMISAAFVSAVAPLPAGAQNLGSVALTGLISSQEEGLMGGVLVSAKGAGTNITISVVSDSRGRYSFPSTRLKPNKYSVSIRAVGYEIGSPSNFEPVPKPLPAWARDKHTPAALLPVEIAAKKTAQLDLKLVKATDLASQLSKGEWLLSFPGAEAMNDLQREGIKRCGYCHSMERAAKSKYDAAGMLATMKRMASYVDDGTSPVHILKWPLGRDVRAGYVSPANQEALEKRAQFLSTVNLSSGPTWKYPFKTFPRPKGEGTKVIYTEYDLPRIEAQPHDAVPDADGIVWYSDFGSLHLGRLDPRTGATKEWRIPEMRQGFPPAGTLSINFDKSGGVWIGSLFQATVYRFNKKTEQFSTWSAPGEYNNQDSRNSMTAPQHSDVDGKVWFGNAQGNAVIHRIDLATGKVETFTPFTRESVKKREHSLYGIASDSKNNVFFADYVGSGVGFIDAKTGKSELYPTPTPHAWPRRMTVDSQDRLWFAENAVNRLAMFDPKTKQIREWEMPTPWTDPYDVMLDKNGDAWTAGMVTDRVVRMNPQTGKFIEYILPRPTQTRRVYVDSSKTPVAFWIGSNLGASVVKLEPLN